MKPLAVLALISIAALTQPAPAIAQADPPSSVAPEITWQEWRSPMGRFKVLMPSNTQESIELIFPYTPLDPQRTFATGVIAHHISSSYDSSYFDIYYFKLEGSDQMPAQQIQNHLDIFTKSIGGLNSLYSWEDIHQSTIDIYTGSISGKELHLSLEKNRGYLEVYMKTFVVDGWMYFVRGETVVITGLTGFEKPTAIPNIRRFLDSFQFNLQPS